MNWITRFLRYVKTWRKHRKIVKELNALDDKTLKDIGLNRGDISHLIWLQEDKLRTGTKGK